MRAYQVPCNQTHCEDDRSAAVVLPGLHREIQAQLGRDSSLLSSTSHASWKGEYVTGTVCFVATFTV